MDFSSVSRALESISRRQPPLSERVLSTANELSEGVDALKNVSTLLQEDERWESLAVGIFIATEILKEKQQQQSDNNNDGTVYMDGPRVPSMKDGPATTISESAAATANSKAGPTLSIDDNSLPDLCQLLHETCMKHLEHKEPRVRTLVAKAVGAYCCESSTEQARQDIHERLVSSIQRHIEEGRDEHGNYSRASTGAIDDTTGWRALETNWLCLAALISAMKGRYGYVFPISENVLKDCEFSCVTHVNRHVRAAGMQCLEQFVRSVLDSGTDQYYLLNDTTSPLRKTVINVLKAGLADNWSQVRMAASVLCRVWFTSLKTIEADITETTMMTALLPRMCLNRFYLAQGVKLYSHETWKLLFQDGTGIHLVAKYLSVVVRYYVKMCDADNHVVREGACQAIAELAVRLGEDTEYHDTLERHMETLLQALLMCFHDESWPVRDEACLACGILCKAYPEACQPEFKTLWERWTEQLTDQIWSVREDAAVALGDALEAYGEPVLDKIRALIKKILPSARDQPAMTAAEYKAHVNDPEQHTGAQMYSCGSLAPKLRKGGAGRIGCTNCGIDRPKAPWEATDGCIYLIREVVIRVTAPDTKTPLEDAELIQIMQELVDVCRVQHFPQSDELRSTLWKNVPAIANALGKQRFKSKYLEIFIDLLFSGLESRTASQLTKHAAGQCAEELSKLVGPPIFRGRLDDYQRECFDRVMHERQMMPKGPGAGEAFSPFGPPGLLDVLNPQVG